MKILFLARRYYPHIGGVEKHVYEVSQKLKGKGQKVTILTEKYDRNLNNNETKDGIKIVRFSFPHLRFAGLIYIWFWLLFHPSLILQSDRIHIHDVFVWYLPFRFLFFWKKVYTTFHGWEGVYPIPKKNIFLKKLADFLSNGTVAVGDYIGKYYGIKPDFVTYGATTILYSIVVKKEKSIVYVGRLEKDTGVLQFLEWLKATGQRRKVDFIGDGSLRQKCEEFGKVHGFSDPKPFLKRAEICVPGGYSSYIEAKADGCKIKVFSDNPLKKDYWEGIKKVIRFPTWGEMAILYLKLWK